MKRFRIAVLAPVMIGFAGCGLTDLDVPNENNPDRKAVLDRAQDIENVIGGAMLTWWEGTEHAGSPSWALSTAADEGTMSWGNFGMQQLSSEPRAAWPNEPSFTYSFTTESAWYGSYGALSSIHDGVNAIANDPDAAAEIDVDRATAFAKLVQGMSHGFLALMYDSAFTLEETVNIETDVLALKPYTEVYALAVAELEDAIAIATAPGVSFTLPATWFDNNALTNQQLAQLAHSYLARLMTQVARTPADRDAVDWPTVMNHVDAGITSDVLAQGTGRFTRFFKALEWYGYQTGSTTWARADYKTIGWTDTSGGFATWLATPAAQRTEFLVSTADARITLSGDPQMDGTDFKYQGPSRFPEARGTYHYSLYGGKRFATYPPSDATLPARWMTTVEMQLIKAEGLLRTAGPSQAVADIINATRETRGQLPPALATETEAALMDKLIYEKRIETYLLCSGCSYFDRRGFGPLAATGPSFHHGLVQGTPLHFAPPGSELEVLQKPLYSYGGAGGEGTSLAPSPPGPQLVAAAGVGVPAAHVYRSPAERVQRSAISPGAAALSTMRVH
ncbi:MAG: hypothetical protein ACREMN_00655 [Gemmatimonadales bacterium]